MDCKDSRGYMISHKASQEKDRKQRKKETKKYQNKAKICACPGGKRPKA
jgi:hypothetical protein